MRRGHKATGLRRPPGYRPGDETAELPDDAAWAALVALLAEHPAHWMLWEGAPLPEMAERLRALDVECVVYDPCGNAPEAGDLLTIMDANAGALELVFSE